MDPPGFLLSGELSWLSMKSSSWSIIGNWYELWNISFFKSSFADHWMRSIHIGWDWTYHLWDLHKWKLRGQGWHIWSSFLRVIQRHAPQTRKGQNRGLPTCISTTDKKQLIQDFPEELGLFQDLLWSRSGPLVAICTKIKLLKIMIIHDSPISRHEKFTERLLSFSSKYTHILICSPRTIFPFH